MMERQDDNSVNVTAATLAVQREQHSYAFRCGVQDAQFTEPFAPEFWVAGWYEMAEYANGFLSVRPSHKIANEWLNGWLVEELASTPPAPSYIAGGEWIEA